MQPGKYFVERQRPHTRSGKFDGERHAVESSTYLRHRCGIVFRDSELRMRATGAVGEQLDCLVGHRQRWHHEGHLAGDPDRFTTRRQEPKFRARREEVTRKRCAHVKKMLTVVEHNQQSPITDEPDQRVHR